MAGPDPVLVGHSFSGVFLPPVPQVRDRGLLVFFAAVTPEPAMFSRDWIEAGHCPHVSRPAEVVDIRERLAPEGARCG